MYFIWFLCKLVVVCWPEGKPPTSVSVTKGLQYFLGSFFDPYLSETPVVITLNVFCW